MVVILLLTACGGALLNKPYMVFQRVCLLHMSSYCASSCAFHRFYLCLFMSPFKSLKTGSQVFALLMLFSCVIVHTMWSGKNLQLLYSLVYCAWLPSELCEHSIVIVYVSENGDWSKLFLHHLLPFS